MKSLVKFFDCGKVFNRSKEDKVDFIVRKFEDLTEYTKLFRSFKEYLYYPPLQFCQFPPKAEMGRGTPFSRFPAIPFRAKGWIIVGCEIKRFCGFL